MIYTNTESRNEDSLLLVSSTKITFFAGILGLHPRDKAAMLDGNTIQFLFAESA